MSDIAGQLATLRALRDATTDPAQRAALDAAIAALQGSAPSAVSFGAGSQLGDVSVGDVAGRDVRKGIEGSVMLSDDARINGVAVGVNLGRIVYGRDPEEDERRRLARYLARLAAKLSRLPLSGLATRLDDGEGVAMERVYVMLAVQTGLREKVPIARGELSQLAKFFDQKLSSEPLHPETVLIQALKRDYHADWVLPHRAISTAFSITHALDEPIPYVLARDTLATEIVGQRRHLVLLGDPGSGKSTFLRHLAWALAQRGLDQLDDHTQLLDWADDTRLLPVFLSLRRLAGQIASEGVAPEVVTATLVRELEREYGMRDAAELLDHALNNGSTLLLLDGLDEVPVDATPTSASRRDTLQAVRAFVDLYPGVKIVITCRTRAFSDELRACLGWDVAQLAAFTLGQIRYFVQAWFDMLSLRGSLDREKATQHTSALIDAIVTSDRLRRMAETPLLLTMMALVLVERGELPRDRPLLYEEVLRQLLGEWDVQKGGQSLAEVLGAPNLRSDDLRPILDRLSFEAHAGAISEDGRGRLPARDLRVTLTEYLERVRVPGAWEAAGRCLTYFSERSGLLLPEDDGSSYAFAHLTMQEHGAGRHLLLQPGAVRAVMDRRADDRWREPISLGLGVAQRLHPMLADRIDRIFAELIDPDEGGRPKARERWYRDLILAADLGNERDWDLLRALISVDRLQRDLKRGLSTLLADTTQPLPTADRVNVGFLLGDMGDPRYPVTVEEWRAELIKAGQPGSYFCRVEPGAYVIGSNDGDPDADDEEKPRHTITLDQPLYIARYPITNAQWRAWVEQGCGEASGYAHDAYLNHPNQPVVGISWYQCNAFCTWLSEQTGTEIRLPTEQEWEASARGSDGRRYPWGDDWRDDHAATEEDSETRGWRWSTPVGCYPAGAAPCGALDMAGNVWEWTASAMQSYPGAEKAFTDGTRCVLRGGGYGSDRTRVRCGARAIGPPDYDGRGRSGGFRVCVSPLTIADKR